MPITDEDVQAFIKAWEEDWQEWLEDGEAKVKLIQLVELYRALARTVARANADRSIDPQL